LKRYYYHDGDESERVVVVVVTLSRNSETGSTPRKIDSLCDGRRRRKAHAHSL